ncbi:hypothetical protein ACWDYH_02685 [Nocardia goodfellowii]
MSRIRLQPTDNHADRTIDVYIGWEPALKTYYAQVFDGIDADGEEIMSVDLGNDPHEISTPDAAIEAVKPYAEVPDDLYERLVADRRYRDMSYVNLTRPEPTHEPDQKTSTQVPSTDRQTIFPLQAVANHGLPAIPGPHLAGDDRNRAALGEQSNTRPMPVIPRPEIEGLDR